MKISGKFILRVAGTLTGICLVVAALLGGVNAVTADRIEAINKANTEASLRAVAANADEFPRIELTDAMTAAAFLVFAEAKCTAVVLEVGLGGRFDATNVIPTPDCALIMNVGLDHTAVNRILTRSPQFLGRGFSGQRRVLCGPGVRL